MSLMSRLHKNSDTLACGTAHYWGRVAQARGHRVVLLHPRYVRPYRRRNKTDRNDCDAILEAARCADIHRCR